MRALQPEVTRANERMKGLRFQEDLPGKSTLMDTLGPWLSGEKYPSSVREFGDRSKENKATLNKEAINY